MQTAKRSIGCFEHTFNTYLKTKLYCNESREMIKLIRCKKIFKNKTFKANAKYVIYLLKVLKSIFY